MQQKKPPLTVRPKASEGKVGKSGEVTLGQHLKRASPAIWFVT